MTDFKQLEDNFYVAGQVAKSDLERAKEIGIEVVINNRPDEEEAGQPETAEVAEWAKELGLTYHDVPVDKNTLTESAITDFSSVSGSDRPTLAFCRTGTRSCILWALDRASRATLEVDAIVSSAVDAGYDMVPMRPLLQQLRDLSEAG